MKEVMSEYGRTIIAAVATVLIISILFVSKIFNGGNILDGTGKIALSMNEGKLDDTAYDGTSYRHTTSTMNFDPSDAVSSTCLIAGKEYSSDRLIQSKSGRNAYSVKVLTISCISGLDEGSDVTGDVLMNGKLTFSQRGIYKVRMRCTNQDGKYFYGNMYINVSPNGGMNA